MAALWSKTHICQCLNRLITSRRNSVVTVAGSRRKIGEQFADSVLNIAREISKLGLSTGDIVAICAFNSDWYLEWMLAVTYVGGIIAPLNYRWSFDESKAALEVIRPVMIVTDGSCTWSSELQNLVCAPRWHVSVDCYTIATKSMENVINRCHPSSIKYFWAPENAAVICFTSGLLAHCSNVPYWGDIIVYGHADGRGLSHIDIQVCCWNSCQGHHGIPRSCQITLEELPNHKDYKRISNQRHKSQV